MKKVKRFIGISILATVLAFSVGGYIAGGDTIFADPIAGEVD